MNGLIAFYLQSTKHAESFQDKCSVWHNGNGRESSFIFHPAKDSHYFGFDFPVIGDIEFSATKYIDCFNDNLFLEIGIIKVDLSTTKNAN